MRNLLILLLLCGCQITNAQNNFFKTFRRPSHERAFSAVQTPDGSFIIAGEQSVNGYYGSPKAYLAKISQSGDVTNEYIDTLNEISSYTLVFANINTGSEFSCIGSSDSLSGDDSFSRIEFTGFDSDLNKTGFKQYSNQKNYHIIPWQRYLLGDTLMYLMNDNVKHETATGLTSFVSIIKYRLPFDSLNNYVFDYYSQSLDLFSKNEKQEIDLYLFPSRTNVKLDFELNYLSEKKYNNRFLSSINITSIGDTNYLFTGTALNNVVPNFLIGCIINNYDDIAKDSLYYTPNIDTNFYAGAKKNTTLSGNNIFITGFYNVHAWPFPYNYNPSWVTITKLDMDLNLISTHFYGGDAQYCPYSIIPTADGGVFVTGYSYDYINNLPNNNYELDIFALKVDSDGLITELPEQPQAKAHDAIVFPNPGDEYVNIQSGPQITGAQFNMYDMQGKIVVNGTINTTQQRFNTSGLSSGTYPWQIVFKNKVIESGKWVKK